MTLASPVLRRHFISYISPKNVPRSKAPYVLSSAGSLMLPTWSALGSPRALELAARAIMLTEDRREES